MRDPALLQIEGPELVVPHLVIQSPGLLGPRCQGEPSERLVGSQGMEIHFPFGQVDPSYAHQPSIVDGVRHAHQPREEPRLLEVAEVEARSYDPESRF